MSRSVTAQLRPSNRSLQPARCTSTFMRSCRGLHMSSGLWVLLIKLLSVIKAPEMMSVRRREGRKEKRRRGREAKERRCPQETSVDIHVSARPSSGVDGGRGGELRDFSELWGEGCDHSVVEYYCQNAHTRTRTHIPSAEHT